MPSTRWGLFMPAASPIYSDQDSFRAVSTLGTSMLEHRYHRRIPQDLPATLHTRSGETANCRITDCCSDGIGLICQDARLHEGVIVEVEIAVVSGGSSPAHPRSYVVHVEGERVGLMWLDDAEVPDCLKLH